MIASEPPVPVATRFNTQNLRGQTLLFRCLDTGFVTTAPALTRYQQGRGINPVSYTHLTLPTKRIV